MEKDKVLQEFLRANKMRTDGANPLEKVMVSLKDHFLPLSDERLPTSSTSDIDCVVSDLERLVTAMKIHRNTLTPIHYLPDDVLSLIFRAYCFGDDDQSIYSTQDWVMIMVVCRRWYNLITNDSFLWSFISADGNVDRITTQLERSRKHLLSIRHEPYSQVASYKLLAKDAYRIGALRLKASADTITAVWNNFLGSNLPPLHSLTITEHVMRDLTLPDSFLTIPSLRYLSLYNVHLSVDLLPRNLVALNLSTTALEPGRVDIGIFLDRVSHMTQLQKLRVYNFIIASGYRPAIPPAQRPLPKLLELSIANTLETMSTLLFVLRVPASCALKISIYDIAFNDVTVTLFYRFISSHVREIRMQPPGTKPLRLLRAHTTFPRHLRGDLEISGFTHTEVKRLPCVYEQSGVDFSFRFFFKGGKYRNRICKRLFRVIGKDALVLDTQSITTQSHQLTEGWWKVALLCLPVLEEVRVAADYVTMVNFCEALSRLCTTHPRNFPRLKAIHVSKVPNHVLRERASTAPMSNEQIVTPERSFERCLFLVKRLKGLGVPLALLSVDLGYHEWPGKKQARELAQFVDCFMYNETTVYDYEAMKANHIAWQADMLEAMREEQGPDFEWPPDEEFED